MPCIGANIAPQDSLLKKLKTTTQSHEKLSIYRNLSDLYFEEPQEKIFLKNTIAEAKSLNNQEAMLEALTELAFAYIRDEKTDSASYYMDVIQKDIKPSDAKSCAITYLNMRVFDGKIRGDLNSDNMDKLLESRKNERDIYEKIERAYLIADGFTIHNKVKEALPYIKTLVALARKLPKKDGFRILSLSLWVQNRAQSSLYDKKQSLVTLKELINEWTAYYETYYKKERPFFNMDTRYLQYYSSILNNISELPPKEALHYLNQVKKYGLNSTNLYDRFNCYMSIANYHIHQKEYDKALAANDTLIKYATVIAPSHLPSLQEIGSQMYEKMGKYKEALESYKKYNTLNDSINSSSLKEQLNELQVKYDVDKLNYEKSNLETKNRHIQLISVSIGLLFATLLCCYLYYIFKREKKLKEELRILNTKVEESEKMKKAFISSICHEIRTPLNSIVGFSDLIVDESIDEETKREFSPLIQTNAKLLTSLIEDMLEVANLDVSDEQLPLESVDMNAICRHGLDKLSEIAKQGIDYHLEIPQETVFVRTHENYLSLVITHLLDNALKFTETGSITLSYHMDAVRHKLILSVTDTGCGIPIEKQEHVFERFSKLDSFMQGNGLGLYLCRLIVTRLSGTICIDSSYTSGTRVVIELPV